MSDTVLSRRLSQTHFSSSPAMSPLQSQVDGLVTNFVHEATNTNTLASIAAGSMAYRFTRLGVMSLGARSTGFLGTLVRPLSIGIGLSGEVVAFEGTGRTLGALSGDRTNPNAWRWSGQGGWGQGVASSLVTFGMLKGAGHLSRESNLIFQHAFSSTAMVAGHNTAAAFGFMPRPEGSLAEQLMHAEATNIQLGAGGSLVHSMAPGVHAFERGLDLSLQAAESGRATRPNQGLFLGHLAMETAGEGPRVSSAERLSDLVNKPLQMSMIGDGDGPKDPSSPRESSGPRETAEVREVPSLERSAEAAMTLDRLRDLGEPTNDADRAILEQNLEWVRQNPDAAREALIGRTDIPFEHLDRIRNILRPEEFRVLTNPNMQRVMIANRGEIALRIARTVLKKGMTPIITYSDSDANQSWVRRARAIGAELVGIGGQTAAESYNNQEKILKAASETRADAIHPGYGYLSENVDFAQAVFDAKIVFIGPSVGSIRRLGDKDISKETFENAGVPIAKGTGRTADVDDLVRQLEDRGLVENGELIVPLQLKPVGGGGGRGQFTVETLEHLKRVFAQASTEALKGFNNGEMMAEIYIGRNNHVERQIIGDTFGNIVDASERECTVQERKQKLFEIHPAQILRRNPGLDERMRNATLSVGRNTHYSSLGTLETLVDVQSGKFYAMEVNTRIQVEHRVSEIATGLDFVALQLDIARGLPLPLRQSDIQPKGGVVEVRLKAQAAGQIDSFKVMGIELTRADAFEALEQQGIFVDTTYLAGDSVNQHADPMIAKIIVQGENRLEALRKMADVLANSQLTGSRGFRSDLDRQARLARSQTVQRGLYDNGFVATWTDDSREDLGRLPHRYETMVQSVGSVPIHLEVGGFEPFPRERMIELEQAFGELLRQEETPDSPRLTGDIAELIRTDPELRQALLSPQHPSPETPRRIWAQADSDGHLRRLVVFEDNRPERMLLTHEVRQALRSARGEGDLRGMDLGVPITYDIIFHPQNHKLKSATLFRQVDGKPERLRQLLAGDPIIQSRDLEFDVLATERSKAPESLNVKLIPSKTLAALEVRDRDGNLLLSLSPERVMHNPAQKLLALFELMGQQTPEPTRRQTEAQIQAVIRHLADLSPQNPARRRAIQQLGTTPVSLIARLLHLMGQDRPLAERAVLGEIMAYREIVGFAKETHMVERELLRYELLEPILSPRRDDPSENLDPPPSVAYFKETRENGEVIPRLMIRSRAASPRNYLKTLEEAVAQLRRLRAEYPDSRDNSIQIVVERNPDLPPDEKGEDKAFVEFLQGSLQAALGNSYEELNLKRVTFIVDRSLDYPDYYTFRRAPDANDIRTGPFVEDTRFRNLHPMLGHLVELRRLNNFRLLRDIKHSDREIHLYMGRNKATVDLKDLKEGEDQRLFGSAIITEAHIQRNNNQLIVEIPEVESTFLRLTRAMHASLDAWRANEAAAAKEKNREPDPSPHWNRMFLRISPILDFTDAEAVAYAKHLAVRHTEQLHGLSLEKVVVKAFLRDPRMPDGYRPVLIRITNPTGYQYEPVIHNIVKAQVRETDGSVRTREVLIENGVFARWLENHDQVIERGDWSPADIPIRAASLPEIRERQSRSRGATWAYHIPRLVGQRAEEFRIRNGLQKPRAPGDTIPPPFSQSHFMELELDPQSTRIDPKTTALDYNQGELIPALGKDGNKRPDGQNQAGVVIGIRTDDLGIGTPVRRMVIMGDLTYSRKARVEGETITEGMGSLSAPECARINAAIRYAQREGIPIDWFPASSGAEIHPERGVEGLDATASVVREIVHLAGRAGVPINVVVDDVNIGAQSYWNSLATIIHNAGGALIMTRRGTMGLTGHVALTSAADTRKYGKALRDAAKSIFSQREHSLASYSRIHGPNGEAMAYAENLGEAIDLLLLHHYYTYRQPNSLVGRRLLGSDDPATRDITQEKVLPGRTIGDEIQAVATGKGNAMAILSALRDQGSPEPQVWWTNVRNIVAIPPANVLEGLKSSESGATQKWLKTTEGNPAFDPLRGLPSQDEPTVVIADIQIGGRPTRVIFHQGQLSPLDSDLFARAIRKADSRMPVLIMGSLPGFNAFPLAMRQQQLRNGAEIAAAISLHEGPISIVDLGMLLGGAYVVFSKQVRPADQQSLHRMIAVDTASARVLGGQASSRVVFSSRIVRRADSLLATAGNEAQAAAKKDFSEEVLATALRQRVLTGVEARAQELIRFLDQSLGASNTPDAIRAQKLLSLNNALRNHIERFQEKIKKINTAEGIKGELILTLMDLDGAKFDAHHSVQRAVDVGSFDEVIDPHRLREAIIRHQEEAIGIYEQRQIPLATATIPGAAQTGLIGVLQALGVPYEIVGQDIRVGAGQLVRLLTSGITPTGGRRGD